MDYEEIGILSVLLIVFGALIFVFCINVKLNDECRNKGGVYVERMCINKDSVIKLGETK